MVELIAYDDLPSCSGAPFKVVINPAYVVSVEHIKEEKEDCFVIYLVNGTTYYVAGKNKGIIETLLSKI